MTAPAAAASHRATSRKDKTTAKKSFWSMEIGNKGASDERVEHPEFVPLLPRVNLLPSSVHASIALRKVIRWFVVLLVLIILAGAVVWYLQGSRIQDAQTSLSGAQTQQQAIEQKVASLAPVKEMYTQIQAQKDLVDATLSAQPQATAVLEHLYDVAGRADGAGPVEFTSASVSFQGVPAPGSALNSCANPDPFATDITIGCMTFSGTATSREQISSLLLLMAADPMFVGPYVDNTTIATDPTGVNGQVAFSGTSGVSVNALAKPLAPEQIDAIVNPPTDSAKKAKKSTGDAS